MDIKLSREPAMDKLVSLKTEAEAIMKAGPLGNLATRWHKTPIVTASGTKIFVKRDDELGVLSIGSKMRKMASLFAHLAKYRIEGILAKGHSRSQFLFALKLLCKEFQIECQLDLLPKRDTQLHPGSDTYAQLVGVAGYQFSPTRPGKDLLLLNEGGFHQACWHAGIGLGFEVASDMVARNQQLDRVYLDAGSGMLALSFAWLWPQLHPEIPCCIVDIGGISHDVDSRVLDIENWGEELSGLRRTCQFELLKPNIASGFGKVTAATMSLIQSIARDTGLLLDPIYGVKAWHAMLLDCLSRGNQKHVLYIHSGGQAVLPGFHRFLPTQ